MCEHKHTTLISTDVAYWIECLDCHSQWDESQEVDREYMNYLNNNMLEAQATGNQKGGEEYESKRI